MCEKCNTGWYAAPHPQTPHLCPVCVGKGIVPHNFYISVDGSGLTSNAAPIVCKSCTGSGIIYG